MGAGQSLRVPLKCIRERAEQLNITAIDGCRPISDCSTTVGQAVYLARQADVVVYIAGIAATEQIDRGSLSLDFGADSIIAAVAVERPTIVLVQAPGMFLMPWRSEVSAIATMFLGGETTGDAWTSLLFGDQSPSGKLPIQFMATEASVIRPSRSKHSLFRGHLHILPCESTEVCSGISLRSWPLLYHLCIWGAHAGAQWRVPCPSMCQDDGD